MLLTIATTHQPADELGYLRVHQAVAAVLACESEPVDPRLQC